MANNNAPVGGTQFYSALQQKAMAAVQGILNAQLYPIQYPAQGDFMWNWQTPNQVFNDGTYQYINALVSPGTVPNTVQLSPGGGFADAYVQVLNDIIFSLSSADQATLAQAQSNASTEAGTIVNDYQAAYGVITTAQMSQVGVSYKVDYVISYVLGSQWSGATPPLSYTEMAAARDLNALLPKAPMGADQIITDVTIYLNLMQPVNGLSSQLQNGAWTIRQLKNNASYPSATNGGMQTADPNTGTTLTGYNEGWGISYPISSISNDLQNTSRTIEISMQTSEASGNSLNVNVEGQAGFQIDSWLSFDVTGGASYDMSKAQGTSTDASVSIKYAGYSIVPMQPAAWQQATNVGFYYPNVIAQALANSGKDVTGFKFLNTSPYNLGSVANGGNFGLLTALLIANYPTITITYQNADFSSFEQSWSEKVSGNLTLFGFIKLGSVSQGAYGSSYAQGGDNSTFSVSFSASPAVTNAGQLLKTAYVIGGAVQNPGVTPKTFSYLRRTTMPITIAEGEDMPGPFRGTNPRIRGDAVACINQLNYGQLWGAPGRTLINQPTTRLDLQGYTEEEQMNLQVQVNGVGPPSTLATVLVDRSVMAELPPSPRSIPQQTEIVSRIKGALFSSFNAFAAGNPKIWKVTGTPSN